MEAGVGAVFIRAAKPVQACGATRPRGYRPFCVRQGEVLRRRGSEGRSGETRISAYSSAYNA